ncbi:MAG: dethiobiotin synthase [Pseudomonadota bacterium]|jgi:dethiobiotin synthetase
MATPLVVAGIGTDVGKTVASAVLCELLKADYWKPVASGTDDGPVDHEVLPTLLQSPDGRIHPPRYVFGRSLSPHVAAALEGRTVEIKQLLELPRTTKRLVIELAGGVLVPLNDHQTNLDILKAWRFPVVVVSRHYLGSINHTLLTVGVLKAHDLPIAGILFNGDELPDTERIIAKMAGVPVLGRLPRLASVNEAAVRQLIEAAPIQVGLL